jgi:hypothetical protein
MAASNECNSHNTSGNANVIVTSEGTVRESGRNASSDVAVLQRAARQTFAEQSNAALVERVKEVARVV